MTDKWVVEYSLKQKAFHKDKLSQILKMNQEAVVNKYDLDYLMIGIFDNEEEANEFLDKWQKELKR